MSLNPYESPDTPGQTPQTPRYGTRFRLIELLMVVGVIGILVALLLPAVRTTREPARRSQCSNQLKQIALALHHYESDFGALPPAYTVDDDGRPLHSWRTLILPYLEQKPLYDKIDLSKPWDDPANREAYESYVQTYHCPSATNVGHERAKTAYLAVTAPGGCFLPRQPRAFKDIKDDRSLTLLVVEVDSEHAVHWMSPSDADEALILSLSKSDKLPHPSGFHAACVDGSVRFVPGTTAPAALRAMISVAGGDDATAQAN